MNDFVQGIRAASMMDAVVDRRRQNEVDNVVGHWSQRCSELSRELENVHGKLHKTNLDKARGYANWHGERKERNALREALAKINPNHPLLADDALKGLHDQGAATYAQERGFVYDPRSGDVDLPKR